MAFTSLYMYILSLYIHFAHFAECNNAFFKGDSVQLALFHGRKSKVGDDAKSGSLPPKREI